MEYGEVKLNRNSAMKVYEWCKKRYGRSKYNGRYPDLRYRKEDYVTEGLIGLYDEFDNIIFINSDAINTLEDLIVTVIHEYVHYTQNIRVDWKVLSKYFDPTSMDHPLERQAEEISIRDFPTCLQEVFGISHIDKANTEQASNIFIDNG